MRSMPSRSSRRGAATVAAAMLLMLPLCLGWAGAAVAADVSCRFVADSEAVEMTVLVGGREHWHDTIKKGESKTVSIPEGPFTVVSKVDNPNLKIKGDIRTDTHTMMCGQHTAISVPLFALAR